MKMMNDARRLRLAGRIVGFTIIGIGGTVLIANAVGEYQSGGFGAIELVVIGLVGIAAMALAGMILTFRREKAGGITLVACSAAVGAHLAVYAGRMHAQVWAMIGGPLLAAGLLFLRAWWVEKRG